MFRGRHQAFIITKILICMAVFTAGILIMDYKIRPVIKTMSSYQAKVYSAGIINDAVYSELEKQNITYDRIVKLTYGENGIVSSLQTDIIALNHLRSGIVKNVVESLRAINDQEIRIPIGTLTGVQFLSGRGKKILFRIIPTGYAETSLRNRFDSAGINQTRHQIMLHLKMTVTAIIPGYTTTTEVESDICMAETVIIGIVPEAFTEVIDSQSMNEKIIDYGASK